ncbi:MAG: hypothetical protein ACM32E_09030 [Gemmatimonadota bacterium]
MTAHRPPASVRTRPARAARPAPAAARARARRVRLPLAGAALAAAAVLAAGCQSAPHAAPGGAGSAPGSARPAHWARYRFVTGVVDLAGPAGGSSSVTVAAGGRMVRLSSSGAVSPFASGPGGYTTRLGGEPYLAVVPGAAVPGAGCSFRAGSVFALRTRVNPGVTEVSSAGRARPFASLPNTFPNGITYDNTGRFGHRLLVTSAVNGRATLFAFDCAGRRTVISRSLPQMEGGIAVAPRSFGAFGGDLVTSDELTGRIYAISPAGQVVLMARSGIPHGHDLGVETGAFIPPGFGPGWSAYVADRRTPGSPHPGTETILRMPGAGLLRAGARPGDLLMVAEGGARSILVRCSASCTVREIGDGPAVAHVEGHVVFMRPG